MAPLSTKRGVLELFVHETRSAERDLVSAVAGTAQGEQSAAIHREVVGSRRRLATRELEQVAGVGALAAPQRGFGRKAGPQAAAGRKALSTTSVVVAALPKEVRNEI